MTKKPIGTKPQVDNVGIPDMGKVRATEKLSDESFVKLWPSVKKYVKAKGGSSYLRKLVLEDIEEKCTEANNEVDLSDSKVQDIEAGHNE